jgi:hypothetical protein
LIFFLLRIIFVSSKLEILKSKKQKMEKVKEVNSYVHFHGAPVKVKF